MIEIINIPSSYGEQLIYTKDGIDKQIKNISIHPSQFGAVGDGVTNDTIAIQKTIDYVTLNHLKFITNPGEVFICNKIFITNKNNFSIDSRGIFKRQDNFETNFYSSQLTIDTCDSFYIDNINFDGNALNNGATEEMIDYPSWIEYSHCLFIKNSINGKIGNMTGINPMGDVLLIDDNSNNIVFDYIYGKANKAIGRNCVSICVGSNIKIRDMVSINIGHDKMPGGLCIEPWAVGTTAKNITVFNAYIETKGFEGVTIVNLNGGIQNIDIQNCILKNYNLTKCRAITIIGADNIHFGSLIIETPNHKQSYGIWTNQGYGSGYDVKVTSNLTIDNLILNTCYYGVMLDNAKNIKIKVDIKNAYGNMFQLYEVDTIDINVKGKFNSTASDPDGLFCVVFNGYKTQSNIKLTGDLSRNNEVGTNCIIRNADNMNLISGKFIDLDMSGWLTWKGILNGNFDNIITHNCRGLTTNLNLNSLYQQSRKVGDTIYNENITEQGTTGAKYYVLSWTVKTKNGTDWNGATYTYVENRVLTGN
jgi:hypothetical protein